MAARHLGIVAAALVTLAAFPAGVTGSFGASLSPVPLIWERDQAVTITDRGSVPVVAELAVDGAGWTLATDKLSLAPGERRSVAVTAAGVAEARLRVTVRPAGATAGQDDVAIVLDGRLRHLSWLDTFDPAPWAVLVLFGLLGAFSALRWLRAARRRGV